MTCLLSIIFAAWTSLFNSSRSLRNFALLFWNHVITCAPEIPRECAMSSLSEVEINCCSTNRVWSWSICWLVKRLISFCVFLSFSVVFCRRRLGARKDNIYNINNFIENIFFFKQTSYYKWRQKVKEINSALPLGLEPCKSWINNKSKTTFPLPADLIESTKILRCASKSEREEKTSTQVSQVPWELWTLLYYIA